MKKKEILLIVIIGISFYFLLLNIDRIADLYVYLLAVMSPLIVGGSLAFIINVPMKKLEYLLSGVKRLEKVKRILAIIISIFVLVGIIALVLMLVIPNFVMTVNTFITAFPKLLENTVNLVNELLERYPQIGMNQITIKEIQGDLIDSIQKSSNELLTSGLGIVSGTLGSLLNFFVSIVFGIYILLSKEILKEQSKRLIKVLNPFRNGEKVIEIIGRSSNIFSNFIMGAATEAVILGIIVFISMLVFKMPFAITISVLIGVFSLIPIFGAFIALAIGFVFIASVDITLALWFIVLILVIQQIEGNLIYPKVVGNSVGLPGIWVFTSVAIGGSLFGIIGMLIMVPLTSVIYSLVKEYVEYKEKINIVE